jgi:hypothetical protein
MIAGVCHVPHRLHLLGCLILVACSGANGDTCHRNGDCASDLACVGPDEGPACGIPPRQECQNDQSCATGEHCNAIADACSATGVGSMCGAACTASSCDPGFRCNASGACEPIPCDQGTTCLSYQQCDATAAHDTSGPVYAHTDGCVNVSCSSDAGCSAGEACVNRVCQTAIGQCVVVMPVP